MSETSAEVLAPAVVRSIRPEREIAWLSPYQLARVQSASRYLPFALVGVVTGWLVYIFAVPYLWHRFGLVALLLVPTVGVYFFTWLGYYRHELWHNYFPRFDNQAWYNFLSHLILADPQVFSVAHSTHHRFVHTPRDLEFFPEHWETDRKKCRRQFLLELVFGNVAWEFITFERLRKSGQLDMKTCTVDFIQRCVLNLCFLAFGLFVLQAELWLSLTSYSLTIWAGALMTRLNQWVEHLGIEMDGSLADRNRLVRNLSSATWGGKLFNFMNHYHAEEHVFHHSDPRYNTRAVTGLGGLPAGANTITFRQYVKILVNHYRSM